MNVYLIDGTYELFRAHFGAPPATDPLGRECGAVLGLTASLLSLLRDHGEDGVAIAFDQVIESFRNELYPGYKTAEGVDPALLAQFPLAEQVAAALGITVWPMRELEADDALATAAAQLFDEPRVTQILLATPDKDLCQCVRGDRVVCLDRRRDQVLDEAGVRAKFGVSPRSIPDYLALVGDSADGFPGLPGWGPASTSAVVGHYRHLEEIPRDSSDWIPVVRGAARLAATLRERFADALLFRELATLRRDAPIDANLETLRWRGAERERLVPLLDSLDGSRLLERVSRWSDQS